MDLPTLLQTLENIALELDTSQEHILDIIREQRDESYNFRVLIAYHLAGGNILDEISAMTDRFLIDYPDFNPEDWIGG